MSKPKSNTTIDLATLKSLDDSALQDYLAKLTRQEQIAILEQLLETPRERPKLVLRTRAEVAAHFGLTPQSITDWLARPDFPGRVGQRFTGDGGYFPIAEIEAWREEQLRKAGRLPSDKEDDDDSCAELIQQERLRKLRLENDEVSGRYIDVEVVKRAILQITEIAKQQLYELVETLPAMLPRKVPKTTRNEFRDKIKAAIDRVTNEISINIHKLKDGAIDAGDPA